ncbi:sugar-binding transcriptional regulator [Microlunatus ginsengisoli]|uniref:Sugar-binding transcriptional regulator n=1 Tax=Microlunatus ginsengisoli TaxID=363863 RepID=A0ABP6ZJD5_9ACTN
MVAQPTGFGRSTGDPQVRLMTKVAHMYHEQGIRQTEIADALHISQAKVSRLLKRAGEVGIVKTIVVVSPGLQTELETQLEQRFGLLEAVVVDVVGEEAEIIAGLGSAGAGYLENTLTGGERIGISPWSQTLLAVVDRLRPLRTAGAESVIQLLGGVGNSSVQVQANRLLDELATRIGARPRFVPAPGLVGTAAMRRGLLKDSTMEDVTSEWASLTMALVGIGSLHPSPLLRQSGNAVEPVDESSLLSLGAVGDVCHRFFDADGNLVRGQLDDRVVGISPADYRGIPRRVGLAGGARKHAAVRAALRGGWVNVLLTDVETARTLLS